MRKQVLKKIVDGHRLAFGTIIQTGMKTFKEPNSFGQDAFCGANPKVLSDPTEMLVCAARDGNAETVEAAMEAGANVNGRSARGKVTPLEAALSGRFDRRATNEVVKLLLDRGADANMADVYGEPPLNDACYSADLVSVRLLFEHGADPECSDEMGWTALMNAVWSGNLQVVKLLVDFGVELDATDDDGNSALHLLVKDSPADLESSFPYDNGLCMASLLIAYGACPDIRNDEGETPLMLAAKTGWTKMAQVLMDLGATPWIMDNEGNLPAQVGKYKVTRRVIASRMRKFLVGIGYE